MNYLQWLMFGYFFIIGFAVGYFRGKAVGEVKGYLRGRGINQVR